jgi:ABC-type multidrug transport system fused ATPase/permease subunit
MAASSFMGGVTEAALLVAITRIGLAVAEGDNSFGLLAGRTMSVGQAIFFAAILVGIRLILNLLSMRLAVSLNIRVDVAARTEVADAYLHASWATQQEESGGRLQELVMGFAGSVGVTVAAFANGLNAGLSLVAMFIGSLLINPAATMVVVVALVALGAVLAPLRRAIRRRARAASSTQMAFASSVSELGALGMEMQAFGVREQFTRRIRRVIADHAGARARVKISQGLLTPLYSTMAFGALIGGLALASALSAGELGGAAAVMLVMLRALSYGQAVQNSSAAMSATAPYLEEIEETVDRFRAAPAELGGVEIDEVGRITADSLSFEYHAEVPVLHDLSFEIEPGEIVGIVGPSGGGKSTLVQLLLGLRNPTSGSIRVGDVDLRDIERRSWSKLTAFVAQDANLLSGTVAENIEFMRDDIDRDHIRAAANDANVVDDIENMADGFDTGVGERGSRLSGGQRQRISIARALAGSPQLLILDEPTSALDVQSEHLIRRTVATLKGRVTVVIIAHRLSTLDACDRIMVIDHGNLTAMASSAELERDNEFFRHSLELAGLKP